MSVSTPQPVQCEQCGCWTPRPTESGGRVFCPGCMEGRGQIVEDRPTVVKSKMKDRMLLVFIVCFMGVGSIISMVGSGFALGVIFVVVLIFEASFWKAVLAVVAWKIVTMVLGWLFLGSMMFLGSACE